MHTIFLTSYKKLVKMTLVLVVVLLIRFAAAETEQHGLESTMSSTNEAINAAILIHPNNSDCHSKSDSSSHNYYCSSTSSVDSCPTWFICSDTENGSCLCGPRKNGIVCNQQMLVSGVLNCYCVTRVENETYLGSCFYNCERHSVYNKMYQSVYHAISDVADLNDFMCGRFNRKGISCGQCKPGLYPLVLSYNLSCVDCPDANKNWWVFVFYGFGPLTLFYVFVVFFNINVTSSRLHGFVLFSQALSTPALGRIVLLAIEGLHMPFLLQAVKLTEPFYSMWNLDPFRSVIPDICLNVSTLQSFALDTCVSLYPMALMLVSYMLIKLHDRNVWCIVIAWKPFHMIFRLIRDKWDIRTSVIDSFSTFFLLSYVKILSVSTDLMLFTSVYELNSKKTRYRLFYDSSIKFLHSDHIPYAALSILIFVVFSVIPTLILILYPFQCFQKCLSYFDIQWHFLRAFVDSFQGCYKDATEPGTRDLRFLSSYGLLLRIGVLVTFLLTQTAMFFIYVVLLIMVIIILLINFEPYKRSVSHYTTIDVSFLILLSLFYTTIIGNNIATSTGQKQLLNAFNALSVICCMVPIIYVTVIILHWMYSRRKWGKLFLMKIKIIPHKLRNRYSNF